MAAEIALLTLFFYHCWSKQRFSPTTNLLLRFTDYRCKEKIAVLNSFLQKYFSPFCRTEPERTPNEPRADPERIPNGLRTDPARSPNGSRTVLAHIPNGSRADPERTWRDPERTPNGLRTDPAWIPNGPRGDSERTPRGPQTDPNGLKYINYFLY